MSDSTPPFPTEIGSPSIGITNASDIKSELNKQVSEDRAYRTADLNSYQNSTFCTYLLSCQHLGPSAKRLTRLLSSLPYSLDKSIWQLIGRWHVLAPFTRQFDRNRLPLYLHRAFINTWNQDLSFSFPLTSFGSLPFVLCISLLIFRLKVWWGVDLCWLLCKPGCV